METEKRLIEANALRTQFDDIPPFIGLTGGCVQQYIDKAPTVDAVEVVRCKDCKKWFAEDPERCKALSASPYGWCCRNKTICDADHTDITQHDDFYSYGEPKEDGRPAV